MTIDPNEQKALVKEAIKEWMDDRARDFGWWVLSKLAIAALTSFLLWYITYRGFKFP